jgi:hypothetical protein
VRHSKAMAEIQELLSKRYGVDYDENADGVVDLIEYCASDTTLEMIDAQMEIEGYLPK